MKETLGSNLNPLTTTIKSTGKVHVVTKEGFIWCNFDSPKRSIDITAKEVTCKHCIRLINS